jgi:hypothetical protein
LLELSTKETSEVLEGGGWLMRPINTLVNRSEIKNKITIFVGHGLLNLIKLKF